MKLYDYIINKVSRCIVLAPFMCLLLVCSCKTKYVPVETVKYDSVYFNRVQTDSVFIKDSVLVVKGDTTIEYRYKYIYRYKTLTDTLYINRTDSVQVPYPVEKELTKWQKLCVNVGGWAIGIVIITILVVVGRLVYKLKK